MSEKQAIQLDDNKVQGVFQSSRVKVVFPEDLISAITDVYVEFIIKVAELYEQDPCELELPGIPLLRSFLKSLGLPPDQRHKAFSKIADATGRIYPDPAETIEDLFDAIYYGENMNEIQTVTIPAHEHHEGIASLTVKLKWTCPICGRPRGQVIPVRSYDGSRILYCDGWVNPCGHIDKYLTVRLEAADNGLNHRVINPTY